MVRRGRSSGSSSGWGGRGASSAPSSGKGNRQNKASSGRGEEKGEGSQSNASPGNVDLDPQRKMENNIRIAAGQPHSGSANFSSSLEEEEQLGKGYSFSEDFAETEREIWKEIGGSCVGLLRLYKDSVLSRREDDQALAKIFEDDLVTLCGWKRETLQLKSKSKWWLYFGFG